VSVIVFPSLLDSGQYKPEKCVRETTKIACYSLFTDILSGFSKQSDSIKFVVFLNVVIVLFEFEALPCILHVLQLQ
jgi:hypothetical protein